ncbi:MAG: flagellar export chaperone FliS [Candidatus Acidiferrales bacterium]
MRDAARTYREEGVRGASPVGLIVILYQEVHRSILKAQQALLQGNIEQRTTELNHAVEVIGHLQSTLNFEKGGEVAPKLSRFYNVARAKILEANILSSKEILEWLSQEFSAHIEAWQTVDRAVSDQEAQAEAQAETERVVPALPRPVRVGRPNANLPHPVRMRR